MFTLSVTEISSIIRRIRKIAKSDTKLPTCLSVRPYGTTQLTLGGFP